MSFDGFPQAGLQFLTDLAANNNREWFQANKDHYKAQVLEPVQAFVAELGGRLQSISADIVFDTRTNGSGSMMRINRDTRFSADKSPYKTRIAMMFWEGAGKKMENPAFGLQFNAEGMDLMAGMFGFDKSMLAQYRNAVLDDDLGAALEEAIATVTAADGYQVLGGDEYKNVPRGLPADHPRVDYLKFRGLHARSPEITPDVLTSSTLVDACMARFSHMAPLQQWLVQVRNMVTDKPVG